MKHTIVLTKLNNGNIIYDHTSLENGSKVVVYTKPDGSAIEVVNGIEITEAFAESEKIVHGVSEETTITSNVATRFAHFFDQAVGNYVCYTSNIQDGVNTVLYYIMDQSTSNYVVFKTDNNNSTGLLLTLAEVDSFLTDFSNDGIPTIPSNFILKNFSHLLGGLT